MYAKQDKGLDQGLWGVHITMSKDGGELEI